MIFLRGYSQSLSVRRTKVFVGAVEQNTFHKTTELFACAPKLTCINGVGGLVLERIVLKSNFP
jgi:hypothetical protein